MPPAQRDGRRLNLCCLAFKLFVADDLNTEARRSLVLMHRRRQMPVAFTLAIIVIGDDDDLAAGKGLQSFGYRMGHNGLTVGTDH